MLQSCQEVVNKKMNNVIKYIKESLAGAGVSGDGGMSAPFSSVGQEIDSRRKQKPIPLGKTMGSYIDEEGEAPANSAGGGGIDAIGIGPRGEPGRKPLKRGKFAGNETLVIPSSLYNNLREAKKKGKWWRKYLGEDDSYHEIKEFAKKKKGPIIVEDERTGACMYIRYGDMK